MKKRIALILAVVMALGMFTACTEKEKTEAGETRPSAVPTPAPTPAPVPDILINSGSGYSHFAAELYAKTAEAEEDNLLISPASAYLALAMTANGSDAATQAAFEQVLGMPVEQLNTACAQLIPKLRMQSEDGGRVDIANAIWLDESFSAKEPFVSIVRENYEAEIFEAVLSESADDINGWVSEKTNGMIPQMLDEAPESDKAMLLFNALYFNGVWDRPFEESSTGERTFYRENGTTVTVPFMNSYKDRTQYIKTENAEGIKLSYNGGKQSFVALRPTDGQHIHDFAAAFEKDTLNNALATSESRVVNLYMPKFEQNDQLDMNDLLTDMGLDIIFDKNQADFSKMGTTNGFPLFVSKVLQKSAVKVDESGTEAAAATEVEMEMAALPMEDQKGPVELVLDSPYAYFIMDNESGIPLFMGIMSDPS
ncbi:serpin family protein [Eubacterium sp. 1001713B170207_170306_E7]|uniref:serpin family protein n=1 Tax=Eubacterium sp. 1001713B170207_170306_E7 TaxID=2787097 RepID=UPI00189B2FBE|nr:serpin family protein [Eubacterium sp. 1001713B170207_170306_E7]